MHILYVHLNYPAQFGHIAERLVERHGFRCSFVTERRDAGNGKVEVIHFKTQGGANRLTHFASRSFENFTWRSHAVLDALRNRADVRPDVIVGHSGFGSTLFLRDFYSCPIVNFCEWFYRPIGGDGDFLPQHPSRRDATALTNRSRDAMLLADLDACTLGYSPTNWQRSRIPNEYQHKLETIFDGIDTEFWRPLRWRERGARRIGGKKLPLRKKIVTYVSRGFESIRGFDVFMQVAQRICERRKDVVFLCIGSDRVVYGGDMAHISEKSFREHVLKQGRFDRDQFIFTGPVPPEELRRAFAYSDLHIYLTVPFILSWSLMDALACGCTTLVSDTPPLREVIEHGQNSLLAPYFDVDRYVELALAVLDDPAAYRRTLGAAGMATIHEQYSLDIVLPQMIRLYECALGSGVQNSILPGDDLNTRKETLPTPKLNSVRLTPMAEQAQLRAAIPKDARLILELGAWRGETTKFLAELCPAARILAVDTWHGGKFREPFREEHPDWKAMLPWIWDSFVERTRDFRGRVVPIKRPHVDAVREVAARGLVPDVVYYDPDYDSQSLRATLVGSSARSPASGLSATTGCGTACRQSSRSPPVRRFAASTSAATSGAWRPPRSVG